jgi:RNase adapter protein RapZ
MITVVSFGYRNGIPKDADLVFDVRGLHNPHSNKALRYLTGRDQKVKDLVLCSDKAWELVCEILSITLDYTGPMKGKSLVVAVGCFAGHHRSVAIAEKVAERLPGDVLVLHPEIGFEGFMRGGEYVR